MTDLYGDSLPPNDPNGAGGPKSNTQLKLMLHSAGHFELDVDHQAAPNFTFDEEITWEELHNDVVTYQSFFEELTNEISKLSLN
ncbi:syntaxin-16, partial [Biomphalaria glabrata]